MYNRTSWQNSTDTMPPTIALMRITESDADVTIKEEWSIAQELFSIKPIVSRDMLLVTLPLKGHRLLNLSDGSPIRDITIATLDCWSKSGLYPLRSQWEKMNEDTIRKEPSDDTASTSIKFGACSVASGACIAYANGMLGVADYSLCYRQEQQR
ncbi:hypothetical protein THASP1DRAFT_33663 [Thamnocephalis sphaerospora]|uniref:Uncharacterized protein n=1 Tax=Thamnocephalis sphaerospora TaxID=78915 RepID=A0A4P9XG32_9FUNG|nr:hypothetical protein THASP1DRAFT_33663 [Thamnocephalis sphaerospora]|eukprot:RKP04557.1 hypothetical protein THASP1DRAFT_33663 [Thamnocephalis sphaerospora]